MKSHVKQSIIYLLLLICISLVGIGVSDAETITEPRDSFWIVLQSAETGEDIVNQMQLDLEWQLYCRDYDKNSKTYKENWGGCLSPMKRKFIFVAEVALDSLFHEICFQKEVAESPYVHASKSDTKWGCIFTGLDWDKDYYWRVLLNFPEVPHKSTIAEGVLSKHKAIPNSSIIKSSWKFIEKGRMEIVILLFLIELLLILFFIISLIKRKGYFALMLTLSLFILFLGFFSTALDISIAVGEAHEEICIMSSSLFYHILPYFMWNIYESMVVIVIDFLLCIVNTIMIGIMFSICRKRNSEKQPSNMVKS